MRKTINYMMMTVLAVGLLAACSQKSNNSVAQTDEMKPKIKVMQVHQQSVEQLYEYTAIVQADVVNNIASTMPGRIEDIFVEVGDRVHVGQELVRMDESTLKQTKTQLDNMEANFHRMDELYKAGGVAKSEWDIQKTQLEVLRTQYQNLLTNTYLKSPISGVITARNNDKGDLYAGNPVQFPILQVQQITPVKLMINVSEAQFVNIKKGMTVDVKLDVFPEDTFKAVVSLPYPTIDAQTHTFPVEITLPNRDSKVRPGMYARVIVNMGSQNHVVVPDVAVVKQQGSGDRYVYVYKDGKVSYNKVELGRRMGTSYELFSGVEDGDYVATTSLTKLNNGMEVEVSE